METSLLFKTFLILGVQLSIVFGMCLLVIMGARKAAIAGTTLWGQGFIAASNARGELDVEIDASRQGRLNYLVWVSMIAMFAMVFIAPVSLVWGLALMTLTSVTLGPVLGLIMLSVDENDGLRAMQLTLLITAITAVIGLYSGIDFSGLRVFLFVALLGLILLRLVMLFTQFASGKQRIIAIGGAALFTLFLLYDFNRLAQLDARGVNDWGTALNLAISLYLDIINLLLEILEAMGD